MASFIFTKPPKSIFIKCIFAKSMPSYPSVTCTHSTVEPFIFTLHTAEDHRFFISEKPSPYSVVKLRFLTVIGNINVLSPLIE